MMNCMLYFPCRSDKHMTTWSCLAAQLNHSYALLLMCGFLWGSCSLGENGAGPHSAHLTPLHSLAFVRNICSRHWSIEHPVARHVAPGSPQASRYRPSDQLYKAGHHIASAQDRFPLCLVLCLLLLQPPSHQAKAELICCYLSCPSSSSFWLSPYPLSISCRFFCF